MSSSPSSPSTPTDLESLGWSDRWRARLAILDPQPNLAPGRVLRHDGASVLVASERDTSHVHLRPATPPLAVGDWVTVGGEVVEHLIERSSLLQRRDPSTGLSQPIAANVDIVGIVCGVDRPLSMGRIERFSAITWDAGALPLIILSKSDLLDDMSALESEIFTAIPGSDVVSVSSDTHTGIDELLARCAGKTIVLVGESGVGKSTLLNAMAGKAAATTGAVREGDHKGRHTTTSRELHLLEAGICLIDTPGVREVGLFTDVDTIDRGFDDITSLAAACRFSDCGHLSEPGCAVQAAIDSGDLPIERLESWDSLRREAASAELRADQAAYRKESKRLGKMYRSSQQTKQRRG